MNEGFSFTSESKKQAEVYVAKYPEGRQASAVIALLDLAQRQNQGHLTQDAIEYVADYLNMPKIRVMEVATFYTMFNLGPVGKYHLQVCGTTPCMLRGAEAIMAKIQDRLDIGLGDLTRDGTFSLCEVECLGACVNAPVVQINDDYYEDLTPERMDEILTALIQHKDLKPGSQIGRQGAAPLQSSPSIESSENPKPKRTRKKSDAQSK